LEKQRKNRGKKISGSRTRRKKERGIKAVTKTPGLILELMAALGNTDADLRSAYNQCPSKLPAKRLEYTYTTSIKWCDGFICCILTT
jgi:hypothetical protein